MGDRILPVKVTDDQLAWLAAEAKRKGSTAADVAVDLIAAATRSATPRPEPHGPAVVYYMGDPASKLVKIGTTTQLRSRWYDLRARKPGLLLLAVEPGTYDVERRRHRQFRHLRVMGSNEWFRKVPQLMEHISTVRAEHGIFPTGRTGVPTWGVAKLKPLVVPISRTETEGGNTA